MHPIQPTPGDGVFRKRKALFDLVFNGIATGLFTRVPFGVSNIKPKFLLSTREIIIGRA